MNPKGRIEKLICFVVIEMMPNSARLTCQCYDMHFVTLYDLDL